ncbi:MAG TPA: hypothetical protein VGN27_07365 [Gaiellaceae bacterium]|jgi:hypothetical protein|nr:hypothetical protein [Gaiellaceae bacterium]
MSDPTVKRLLESAVADPAAEQRAWAVVEAAYAERVPVVRPRRLRVAVAVAAVAAAAVAAVVSAPGRAVVDAVRKSIGIEHAQPALFRLPTSGRVLVSGAGGAWVVAADGSTRRLGSYTEASWSPHALYVLAASRDELAALEPGGTIRWTLARSDVRFPRWGGSRTDTRVAYLSGTTLHVVAGDGTGDAPLGPAALVAPAWRPGDRHVLAYVTAHGSVVVRDTDARTTAPLPGTYGTPRSLTWSPDGRTLVLATAATLVRFDVAARVAHRLPVRNASAVAFSGSGRLAVLRGSSVLLVEGGRPVTLFATSAPLAGLAWSPDSRWLLTGLPAADQWIFVQARGGRRVLAVSHVRGQFGGAPQLDGWATAP